MQAEHIGQASGRRVQHVAVVRVRVEQAFAARVEEQLEVIGHGQPDEDTRAAPRKFRRSEASVFERLPGDLQQQPVLRVHAARLARRDAEELGIKFVDVLQEAAAARVDLPDHVGIVVEERVGVPAASRDLGGGVDALAQQRPEGLEIGRARNA